MIAKIRQLLQGFGRSPLKRNFLYSMAEKSIRFFLGFFILSKIVGHLDPSEYGATSYLQTVFTICYTVSLFGLDALAVKYLLEKPTGLQQRFWQLTALRLASSVTSALIGIGICTIFSQGVPLTLRNAFWLFAVAQVFRFFDISRSYFEAKMRFGVVAIVEMSGFLLFLAGKAIAVFHYGSLIWFIALTAFEPLFASVILFGLLFTDLRTDKETTPSPQNLGGLFRAALPIYIGGVAVMIYMRLDNLMINWIGGSAALGIYTAAVRISEALYLFATTLGSVLGAKIYQAHLSNEEAQSLADRVLGLAIVFTGGVATLITLVSPILIPVLYGEKYADAVPALQLHVWSLVFVTWGSLTTPILIKNGLNWIVLQGAIFGAVLNALLNILIIPRYGAVGAAATTTISSVFAGPAYYYMHSASRAMAFNQIKSIYKVLSSPKKELVNLIGLYNK